MPAAVKSPSRNQGNPSNDDDDKNGANGDPKVSELVFRIKDVANFKVGEFIKSPTKLIELFTYQLKVYPMGEVENSLSAYVVGLPTSGVSAQVTYENVVSQITLVNHRNDKQSITRRGLGMPYDMKSCSWGWAKLLEKELQKAEDPDFFDDEGGIVMKARVDLTNARLNVTPAPILPPGPNEQEVRIEDVADYKRGEDIKFKPVWKGNYRTQVAVCPGGHPDHAAGQEALAVYSSRILEKSRAEVCSLLALYTRDVSDDIVWMFHQTLKVAVVNQKEFTDSIVPGRGSIA